MSVPAVETDGKQWESTGSGSESRGSPALRCAVLPPRSPCRPYPLPPLCRALALRSPCHPLPLPRAARQPPVQGPDSAVHSAEHGRRRGALRWHWHLCGPLHRCACTLFIISGNGVSQDLVCSYTDTGGRCLQEVGAAGGKAGGTEEAEQERGMQGATGALCVLGVVQRSHPASLIIPSHRAGAGAYVPPSTSGPSGSGAGAWCSTPAPQSFWGGGGGGGGAKQDARSTTGEPGGGGGGGGWGRGARGGGDLHPPRWAQPFMVPRRRVWWDRRRRGPVHRRRRRAPGPPPRQDLPDI